MYEDKSKGKNETYISDKDRVLAWTKDVAKSTANEAPHPAPQPPQLEARYVEREPPRVIVNQVITTPAVVITRARPESRLKDEISTKAFIGTVLGATAGAVVAYAMTKSQTENSHVEQPSRVAHRIIKVPVTYELIQPDNDSHLHEYFRADSKPTNQAVASPPLPRPHVDDLIPRSEHSHPSSHSVTRSHVEGLTCPPYVTKVSVADAGKSRALRASLHEKPAGQSDSIPLTETKSAKDVPLPQSRLTSLVTEEETDSKARKSSVSPKESVSQARTKRLGRSSGSKHSSHHSGSGKDHDEHGNHKSRTSRK